MIDPDDYIKLDEWEFVVHGYWNGDKENKSFFLLLAKSPEDAIEKISTKNPRFTVEGAERNIY